MSQAPLAIIIPMAGHGSRFSRAGYATPKPLIEVDGLPMFVKAASSLPMEMAQKIIFIALNSHINKLSIDKIIKDQFPDLPTQVIGIEHITRGQAESVWIGLERACIEGPILIFNADSAFESNIAKTLQKIPSDAAGALQYFFDSSPRWSFMKVDSQGYVLETAEKQVISECASTGLYYFASAKEYKEEFLESQSLSREIYIAPIYNNMIRKGRKIIGFPAERYYCFGTPEDLEAHRNGKFFTGKTRDLN